GASPARRARALRAPRRRWRAIWNIAAAVPPGEPEDLRRPGAEGPPRRRGPVASGGGSGDVARGGAWGHLLRGLRPGVEHLLHANREALQPREGAGEADLEDLGDEVGVE